MSRWRATRGLGGGDGSDADSRLGVTQSKSQRPYRWSEVRPSGVGKLRRVAATAVASHRESVLGVRRQPEAQRLFG